MTDNKARRRKIYTTGNVEQLKKRKETQQDSLDRMGYEAPSENPSADEYVKSLGL